MLQLFQRSQLFQPFQLIQRGQRLVPLYSCLLALFSLTLIAATQAQEYKHSNKPPLHGSHWVAITGKPLAASAGALTFSKGGNAVDAACAMLAAAATMWDTLSWGGETQALIHNPNTGKVIAINALGAAPSGATPEYFHNLGMAYPPEYGPLAAITPGTPGGLLVMLAEFGTMSLEEVLAPAMEMAKGYPIEETQSENIEGYKPLLQLWDASRAVLLPHYNPADPGQLAAPQPGEMLVQEDPEFTKNFLDPGIRSCSNGIQVVFSDETSTARIDVYQPLGHASRIDEVRRHLEKKLVINLAMRLPDSAALEIMNLYGNAKDCGVMTIKDFTRLFTSNLI